jgi:hypothetical protein
MSTLIPIFFFRSMDEIAFGLKGKFWSDELKSYGSGRTPGLAGAPASGHLVQLVSTTLHLALLPQFHHKTTVCLNQISQTLMQTMKQMNVVISDKVSGSNAPDKPLLELASRLDQDKWERILLSSFTAGVVSF